ncbi:hypothetical protein [Seonamhaeicola sp.]|uniref:hypothetical protein n=1 Tax=Seonamhaeicola sp. TaxID=1912245 RepID=UPI002612AA4F|nr:hypothetical protein [Seonamhaeicola sp.]
MMKRPQITYHHFSKATFLLVLLVLLSCKTNKNVTKKDMVARSNPKILFLNYTIEKTNNSSKRISLINKIKADGTLKQNNFFKKGVHGDLNCNLLDKKGHTIESFVIKNPLFKTIEYVDESKHFKVKQLDLDNAQFTLRFQLNPSVTSISITEIDTLNTTPKPLIKTELN